MSRVVLTGARGFIGRHTLPLLLQAGHEVHAVHTGEPGPAHEGLTWHRADLLKPGEAARLASAVRAEILMHLAWYAEPGKFWTSPSNLRWVQASLELVEAFATSGGKRVIVAGTSAEYDDRHQICIEGVTPLAPRTLYGACKRALSDILAAYAEHAGFQLAWGRVFLLYGPHEDPRRFVASLVSSLLRGEAAKMTHGEQVRDFLHVRDVARAFASLATSSVTGPVNIASGHPVSLRDVAAEIARRLEGSGHLQIGALPQRTGEPAVFYASATRLQDEVGWTPELDLAHGLDDTINWWRGNLENS
jgi:nucleoside-diphosphate-sugar epimerase